MDGPHAATWPACLPACLPAGVSASRKRVTCTCERVLASVVYIDIYTCRSGGVWGGGKKADWPLASPISSEHTPELAMSDHGAARPPSAHRPPSIRPYRRPLGVGVARVLSETRRRVEYTFRCESALYIYLYTHPRESRVVWVSTAPFFDAVIVVVAVSIV